LIPANDIVKRIEEIKYYVSVANFEEALKRLIDLTRDFCQDQEETAITISANYHLIYQSELTGVVDFKDLLREKNSIALRILRTLPLITQNLSAA
jgi:hypothetical protein